MITRDLFSPDFFFTRVMVFSRFLGFFFFCFFFFFVFFIFSVQRPLGQSFSF